jgi:hypothetical protein
MLIVDDFRERLSSRFRLECARPPVTRAVRDLFPDKTQPSSRVRGWLHRQEAR